MKNKAQKGFTLAELLISLAILGVIATFTIPKLLTDTFDSKNSAIAKEAASMVSGAFSVYQLNNSISAGTKGSDLTQFLNYVAVDTATHYTAGANQNGTALQACSSSLPCLKLHNGGIIQYDTAMSLGGSAPPSAFYFNMDPDGSGTQGAITFVLFANGRFSTGQQAGTASPSGGTLARIATDPAYLQNWN